jgi:folate-binding protein YgfZ
MADALNAAGSSAKLAELSVLRVSGTDALPFLQGQLSNDIERVTRERASLSSLNTAQGRVLAILRLARRAEGLIAILPAGLLTPVIDRLRRYVLRSKVTLSDESARLEVAGVLDAGPASAELARDEVSWHALPGVRARHLLIGPAGTHQLIAAKVGWQPTTAEHWRLSSIECGEPQVYRQTSDLFVAQMLNLDLVDGVSFTKGCYTGQEIIARTQHRGRIKRRMLRYRVRDSVSLEPGDTVVVEDRAARVVEVAGRATGESEMLAVVTLGESTRADTNRAVRHLSAERLPLPYSIPDLD